MDGVVWKKIPNIAAFGNDIIKEPVMVMMTSSAVVVGTTRMITIALVQIAVEVRRATAFSMGDTMANGMA